MAELAADLLGRRWSWLAPLVKRVRQAITWHDERLEGAAALARNRFSVLRFLMADRPFQRAAIRPPIIAAFEAAQRQRCRRLAATDTIAAHLAAALLGGPCEIDELKRRGADALGQRWRWLSPLARRIQTRFAPRWRPSHRQLVRFLLCDVGFRRACGRHVVTVSGIQRLPAMYLPRMVKAETRLPELHTEAELADWLELNLPQLDWLADCQGRERYSSPGRRRNYHYRWLAKRSHGSARLIEAPKHRLRMIQKRILHELLDPIPPHHAAHGYCKGHGTASFVAPHVGQDVVIRFDLRDFFPSVTSSRVAAIFRLAGYPDRVSWLLSGLCTNRVPGDVWTSFPAHASPLDDVHHRQLYQTAHLPQGAPTSPALANLCCFRLDARLAGLARWLEGNYTRYADDLVFSGGQRMARAAKHLLPTVLAIASDEGFVVNARKTRIMRRSGRQMSVGLVLNAHRNIPREQFDLLKATLHNCVRWGPASQNRSKVADFRAHLNGRVQYVESICAARGARLRALFERIQWEHDSGSPIMSLRQ